MRRAVYHESYWRYFPRAISWCVLPLAVCPAVAGADLQKEDLSPRVVIEKIGTERGLAVENVTALYQDRAGFAWIGTRQGLILYDGQSTTTFEHDVRDLRSIPDNFVRTIYEDRDLNLWIGTNSSGLARLDRANWTFETFRHDSADPQTISHDSVNVILQDREGMLWVGTQIGLNRFDPRSGTFQRFHSDPANAATLANDYVYALLEDHRGELWIGTVGGGLDQLDRRTGVFTHRRHDSADPSTAGDDRIFALAEDAQGNIWIGTNGGLDRLDRDRSRVDHFPRAPEARRDGKAPIVTTLAVDGEGTLWIGTWGDGLGCLDVRTGAYLGSPSTIEPELARRRITSTAIDSTGAVWVGTWAHGVLRAHRPAVEASVLGPAQGLGLPDVTAVLEDGEGRLWAGTWGSGLYSRARGESRFDDALRSRLGRLTDGTVLSLEDAGEGAVWVGTMETLFRVDASGVLRQYVHEPARPGSLGPGYITALLRDSDGVLWVGVGGSGLYRLRHDGSGFDRFIHDPGDESTLSDDYITSLLEARDGVLWVATRSGGVNECDRATGRCIRHLPDPGNPRSLSYHAITAMAEDGDGVIWIATSSGGLNAARRTKEGVFFDRITQREGLPDDILRALAVDGSALWLTTAKGLTRFDTADATFNSFGSSDGLPTSGFNGGAASTGRDKLYFGSTAGLVEIERGSSVLPAPRSPTVLRAVRTLQGSVPGDRPPWDLERLEVPYGEVLSFAFAVLDYGDARRHRFAYRLAGLRDDWVDIGDRREVTFTDLNPGRYTLGIRARNAHGVWSESQAPLTLVVVPPFWMTLWFRLLTVSLLALAVLAVHRQRTSALKKRNRELLALKDQREAALAEMRAGREELHETYDRLRRLTRRLEDAREDERKHIARELHDEMGQALTAAKINLQIMASSPVSGDLADRIADTVGLVDRMIRHVRTLSLDLRPPLLDEFGLDAALRSYLEAQAQRTGLGIDVTGDGIPPELGPEVAITAFRFLQEAVTNVIRHADASRVKVAIVGRNDELDLEVRDDGTGFDVGNALLRAAGGQHLGLLGIRERVESLGGSMELDSAPGRGTRIAVSIPWR